MNDNETTTTQPEPIDIEQRILDLQRKIDDRDEKIRRLNEALALALSELQLEDAA